MPRKKKEGSQETVALPDLMYKTQYMNNTKTARVLSTKDIQVPEEGTMLEIPIGEQSLNTVDLKRDRRLSLSDCNISQFDMAVMDSVYTILKAGHRRFSAEWVAKVLTGNAGKKTTSPFLGLVKASLEKLSSIRITIDCSTPGCTYKNRKPKTVTYQSYLLPLDIIEAKYAVNGRAVTAYEILAAPALYRYAEKLHQVINIPASYLNTQEYFQDTEESLLVKRYVIKRVMQIIHENRLESSRISFRWHGAAAGEGEQEKGLFAELGYRESDYGNWRKKRSSISRIVQKTLQALKDKGVILDFQAYRENDSKKLTDPVNGYLIDVTGFPMG